MKPRLALVYGGGGPFATAAGMGVAHALRDHGVALDGTPALGTSGGAWAAAAVFAELSYDRVVEVTRHVGLPERPPGRLEAAARELFGTVNQPLLWTSVVRLRDGRRALLSGAEHPVADIVAASSAVPLMAVPRRVGQHLYVDGGTRSWISADLAPASAQLLIVAPGVAPVFGRFGVALRAHLAFEIGRWKRLHGGNVRVIRVDEEIAVRVRRWKDLFDQSLARETYARAREATLRDLSPGARLDEFCRA